MITPFGDIFGEQLKYVAAKEFVQGRHIQDLNVATGQDDIAASGPYGKFYANSYGVRCSSYRMMLNASGLTA